MSLSIPQQSALDSTTTQLRTLAQRLSAYIPVTLTRKILQDDPLQSGQSEMIKAATMFADMSGFTPMAEALAVNGARGTEALSRALLMTFTSLINAIHDAGGAVSHFHGDAMMVYFPDTDGQAASRALASAQFMQSLMQTNFAEVNMMQTREKDSYKLSIKIGVGYGRCLEMLVGDADNMEFVLAGTAVEEAVAAQMQAMAGQVVASQAALKAADLPASEPFRLVDELPPVPHAQEGFFWEAYEQPALMRLITAVPAFIPPSLFERLQDRSSQSISEHRSVTSMFVQFDGIDFTDSSAGAQLQAYYQWAWRMVQRYGGPNSRVNRVLMGDKGNQLHILFGAPVAPDAPEQALRCALAMQQHRPDFISSQRIGLTVGRVFAGAVGSLNRREYTVVGRMVNLSARLTQICPPDGILVDADTAVRVQPHIVSKPLPPMELKGHREPVSIYQVMAEQTAVTQAQARFQQWQQPPVGRDEELKQLYARMASALEGDGGLVTIHGSYGSGQMPFLAAGVRHWLEAGGHALVGVCQQHTSDVPYAPWVSVWRDFFELGPEMSAAEQVHQLNERIAQLTPDVANGLGLWRELLGAPLRSTALLVDLPAVVRQMRLFKLVHKSVTVAVAERPYLIVLEDIHLADSASLDLLDALVQHSHDLPLLLLVTYRSGNALNFNSLQTVSTEITLNDFTPQQARRLIREQLGTDDLPLVIEQRLGLRDRQGRESAVNPLFLEETLQLMLSLDVVAVEQNQYGNGRLRIDEARLAQMQVPDTIYTLLLARLDQLPAAERGLLQVASVIGREFDLATLVAISPGLNREAAIELLDTLVQTDLVQQLSAGMIPTYLFQHNLVHQVVYQSLTYARRQALHTNIAELIIRESGEMLPTQYPILAYHFSQTEQHGDGLKYALLAAEDAGAAYNYRGAAEFYKQAAHHLDSLGGESAWETAVTIAVARSKILVRLGQFAQAWDLAAEALQLCLDQQGLTQTLPLYNLMAEIRLRQARYTEVPTLTSKVINSLLPDVPPAVLGQAYWLWGQALLALADCVAAVDKLKRAETLFRDNRQPKKLGQVLLTLAEANQQQQPDSATLNPVQEVEQLLQEVADPALLGQKALFQSRLQLRLGRADLALAAAETAVANLRSAGANALVHGLIHRAAIHIYRGQFVAALADLQRANDLLDSMDDGLGLLKLHLLWGVGYHGGLSEWHQAQQRLVKMRQLLADQPQNKDVVGEADVQLWLGLGCVALHTERWPEAESLLKRVLTAVTSQRLIWWRPAALYAWGMLLLARASEDNRATAVAQAHQSFREGLQAVHAGGCPDELPLILLQLGLTAEEMVDERCWYYLETAVQAARQRARHTDRLFVLHEAGQTLLQAPDVRLRQLGQEILAHLA